MQQTLLKCLAKGVIPDFLIPVPQIFQHLFGQPGSCPEPPARQDQTSLLLTPLGGVRPRPMSESLPVADPMPAAATTDHPSAPSLNTDPTSPLREAWLHQGVEALRPIFRSAGHLLPPVRVSCGFASTGLRSNHIGQCWSRSTAPDGINQIFISPVLADPVQVLDTLVHELVHAVDDCEHHHGPAFKKIALSVGLKGPMRSASATPALLEKLGQIAQRLGAYPHAELRLRQRPRKSAPRPRARCPQCDYTVPMLRPFLVLGPPLCPVHRIDMAPLGDWNLTCTA